MKTDSNILAEAVRGDYHWSTGLDKELLMTTKMKFWPGKNVMGKLLRGLRTKLKQKEKDAKKHSKSKDASNKKNETESDSDYNY